MDYKGTIGVDLTGGDVCEGRTALERMMSATIRGANAFPDYQFYASGPGDQICDIHVPGNIQKIQHEPGQQSLERLLMHADKLLLDAILTHAPAKKIQPVIFSKKTNLTRVPGLRRLALLAIFPTQFEGEYTLLLDGGANVENSSLELEQYAHLGRIAAKHMFGIQNPTVALGNVGEEEDRGTLELKKLYEKLAAQDINFIGFVEPAHIFGNESHTYRGREYRHPDVVVVEGRIGNWGMKNAEAIPILAVNVGKQEFFRKTIDLISQVINYSRVAVAAGISVPLIGLPAYRTVKRLSPKEYGGAIVPGIRTANGRDILLVKGHGSADEAMYVGLERTVRYCEKQIAPKINTELAETLLKTDTVTKMERDRIAAKNEKLTISSSVHS